MGFSVLPYADMQHLSLKNSLTKKQEVFEKDTSSPVLMYNCGPTVYDVQHIGNLSSFVFADTIRKTLELGGYAVKQVINITDIGHLSGDNAGDPNTGDDKMMRGLRANNLPVSLEGLKTLSEKYTAIFLSDVQSLSIPVNDISFPRATEYIPEQIAMIEELERGGHVYTIADGVYFDVATFPEYGALGGGKKEKDETKVARIETNHEKRNDEDFVLWKKNHAYGWDSPWGKGFPGWHIECSAMATKLLGKTLDIHTGGIEHVTIHHNNEIAQSECANHTTPFSRFWVHRNHIQINNGKISKSSGEVIYLSDIIEKGFSPSDLRYFFLQAHYATESNFTWDALKAASVARRKLAAAIDGVQQGSVIESYKEQFVDALHDDLNTPKALSVLFVMLSDDLSSKEDKAATIVFANKVLALDLTTPTKVELIVPDEDLALMQERIVAKQSKDFAKADAIRDSLAAKGYLGKDVSGGILYSKDEAEKFLANQ